MPAVKGSTKESRKVLLVNPNLMKPPVAPIALDYLAHALRESRFDVDVLDLCFADDVQREIHNYFARNEVMAIAVTLRNADDTFFVTQDFCINKYKDLIDLIKARSAAPVILGGSGFSIMPVDIMRYYDVNLGIWGEGEYSLPLLLNRIRTDDDLNNVPGLIYRNNGEFITTPTAYLDLGRMSTPGRNAVDNRRYFLEGAMGNIETKRGCPNDCIYCVDPVGKGVKVRLRSPQSVVDEIESLIEMGIDALNPIQVSAANMDTKRLKKEFGKDITFWGGGCDTQTVLPYKTVNDVKEEVQRRVDDLAPGGGFVFCQVHNIQADVPVENILAMYEQLGTLN